MENSERDFGARVCFIIPSNWNYEINIFFFFSWPHDAASGVLVPWVGIEPETLQ